MAIFPVRIDTNGRVINADRRRHLSKGNQDEIQWVSQGNSGPWRVVFPDPTPGPPVYHGSPFGSPTFDVPRAGNVRSGTPTVDPGDTEYKYEVRDTAGTITDDPDVLIDD